MMMVDDDDGECDDDNEGDYAGDHDDDHHDQIHVYYDEVDDDDGEYSHESQVDKIHLTGSLTASPPVADTVTTF